jgi:hypothetical protein
MTTRHVPEDRLLRMATDDPNALASLIDGGTLRPATLTFAAEYLGHATDTALVTRTLLPLLDHELAYVREGAMLGLGRHQSPAVVERLRLMVERDPVLALREMARDMMDNPPPQVTE